MKIFQALFITNLLMMYYENKCSNFNHLISIPFQFAIGYKNQILQTANGQPSHDIVGL